MDRSPRPLIAGNWKMNGRRESASKLVRGLLQRVVTEGAPPCDILVCPPATLLAPVEALCADTAIALGGQDCHTTASGPHTGDISAEMLADSGCGFVIVGHSERRADHGEDDAVICAKAAAAIAAGLIPIICVGETAAERDAGRAVAVVTAQLDGSLPEAATAENVVIAYEPVWAIGTGRTPTTADIAEVHNAVRTRLEAQIEAAEGVRILYGGSVKRDNAAEILRVANVNGALVGGASLNDDEFWAICRSCP